jgi:hypothetical protein
MQDRGVDITCLTGPPSQLDADLPVRHREEQHGCR